MRRHLHPRPGPGAANGAGVPLLLLPGGPARGKRAPSVRRDGAVQRPVPEPDRRRAGPAGGRGTARRFAGGRAGPDHCLRGRAVRSRGPEPGRRMRGFCAAPVGRDVCLSAGGGGGRRPHGRQPGGARPGPVGFHAPADLAAGAFGPAPARLFSHAAFVRARRAAAVQAGEGLGHGRAAQPLHAPGADRAAGGAGESCAAGVPVRAPGADRRFFLGQAAPAGCDHRGFL